MGGAEAQTGREGGLSQQVGKGTWMSQAELPAISVSISHNPGGVLMAWPGSPQTRFHT